MLVLSRKQNQSIIIDGGIRVTIVGIRGNQVRLGIEAPDAVAIFREELWEAVESNSEDREVAATGAIAARDADHSPATPETCSAIARHDRVSRRLRQISEIESRPARSRH